MMMLDFNVKRKSKIVETSHFWGAVNAASSEADPERHIAELPASAPNHKTPSD